MENRDDLMIPIDWQSVVDAMREGRFEKIKKEVWILVADKIVEEFVPKKQGAPKKPAPPKWNNDITPQENGREFFKYMHESTEYKRNKNVVTPMDYYREIEISYDLLIEQGETAGKAKRRVAADMTKVLGKSVSWQGINNVLLAINAYNKSLREIEESERASKKLPSE